MKTVEDPPWVRHSDPGPLDLFGLVALSLWLGCQEIALDKGQEKDWFGSGFIRSMALLAVIGFVAFVLRELKAEKPMVELRIFRVRNFALGTVLIFITSVLIYGLALLTPQFLEQLMGYTSLNAGCAIAPLGLGAVLSMVLVALLVHKLGPRVITAFGFLVFALGAFMLSRINLGISPWTVFWPQVLAGSAMGFLFVPINVAGTAPLRRGQIGSATGTLNLLRNVGGSVGIAMVSTFLARRSQVHQTILAGHLTPGNPLLVQTVHGLKKILSVQLARGGDGVGPSLGVLYRILQQQSGLLAFTDVYEGLALLSLSAVLLVFLMAKTKTGEKAPSR